MTDQNHESLPPTSNEEDPNVVGRLNDEEMAQWTQARQMGNQTILELGNMFLRGVRLVSQVDRAEHQVRQMLQGAAKRMGLADDVKFQALPDGRIRVIADVQPTDPETQVSSDGNPEDSISEPTDSDSSKGESSDPDDPDPMASVARAKAAIEADKAKEKEAGASPSA